MDALETYYNNGFLIGLRQAAEISEYRNGRCFNCQKESHRWRQCKEPLTLELQELAGAKGGHAPTLLAGANPAAPQVPGAPAQ